MFPTAVRLSKASRAPLTPKRAGKDYYKGTEFFLGILPSPDFEFLGTRQAFLPGGPRTGAPGRHVVRGKAKYRLLDEKVRVFVAPSLEEIELSPVRTFLLVGFEKTEDFFFFR